jgi:hypothetical protein
MGHSEAKSIKRITRRSLIKLPGLCSITSLLSQNPLARVILLAALPKGAGTSELPASQRTLSLNGTWSLTYGPCPDAPEKLPQTAPPSDGHTIPAMVSLMGSARETEI